MPTTRRGLLGGLFFGGAAAAVTAASPKIVKAITVPEGVASQEMIETIQEAGDGELVFMEPDHLVIDQGFQYSGIISMRGATQGAWFGVPNTELMNMSPPEYVGWLHAHLEVNRKFGVLPRTPYNGLGREPERGENP